MSLRKQQWVFPLLEAKNSSLSWIINYEGLFLSCSPDTYIVLSETFTSVGHAMNAGHRTFAIPSPTWSKSELTCMRGVNWRNMETCRRLA